MSFAITMTLNLPNVGNCCVRVGSGVKTDAKLPTMLACFKLPDNGESGSKKGGKNRVKTGERW